MAEKRTYREHDKKDEWQSFLHKKLNSNFCAIDRKRDKMRAMDNRWEHDMFEMTERKIESEPRASVQPAELFLSNLHFDVTESDIMDLFSIIGRIKDLKIHYDKAGRPTGSAIVYFERKVDAMEALNEYNGQILDGKPLKIELLSSSSSNKNFRCDRSIRHYNKGGISRSRIDNRPSTSRRETHSRFKDLENLSSNFENMHLD